MLHSPTPRATPLPAGPFKQLYADLPFGSAIGSHVENEALYPALLREAARIATDDAVCVFLTHEINLLRRCVAGSEWRVADERRITLSGFASAHIYPEAKRGAGVEYGDKIDG